MNSLDKVGIFASVTCAVHCALLPIIILFLPSILVSLFINEIYEWIFLVLSLILGLLSFCYGFKKHKSLKLISFVSSGFILMLISKIIHHNYHYDNSAVIYFMSFVGGIIVAFSHFLNDRFCKSCMKCSK